LDHCISEDCDGYNWAALIILDISPGILDNLFVVRTNLDSERGNGVCQNPSDSVHKTPQSSSKYHLSFEKTIVRICVPSVPGDLATEPHSGSKSSLTISNAKAFTPEYNGYPDTASCSFN
jgi:hypothetical protein